jgi:hypothetical protein
MSHLSFSRINLVDNNEIQTNEPKIECKIYLIERIIFFRILFFLVIEPKIENLLTMNTMIVEQRRVTKTKQKCKFFLMKYSSRKS